ncbi:magnesium transporter [Candidatus Stoquefichus massiliensis]|uniref:magnesium transporter n=1 Tax=Candidatus Stoquefichus massiliensis TaxID=1470350 RepID=UPI000487E12F|nr:magnesium transporter [Candidatus Stoquefichus massiliensis]
MENKTQIQLEKLLQALVKHDTKEIDNIYGHVQPIDLALEIEELEDNQLEYLCNHIDDEKLAEILEESDEELQTDIIDCLDNQRILRLFNHLPKDIIVDILGELPIGKRKQLMTLMKTDDQKIIEQLLGYAEDSAGGLMTTEYIALNDSLTMINVLKKIKEIGPKTEVIETIFVLNHKKQLIGTADLRDILVSDEDTTLREIMDDQIISVFPETDQEEVSLLVSKYDLATIPVVNKNQALLGIITVDDIIDVIQEEHTEDMLQMHGVSKEESLDSTLFESIQMRLPWLVVNLATAFLASFTVKMFESTIEQIVALSATMTIVTGMGGNAGSQTLSIMIRSIALGEVHFKDCFPALIKEILLGIINGLVTGVITGFIVYVLYGNFYLGVIICIAMIGNLVVSGFFGFVIPVVLKALHADPALASSIFLTTATDVLGFFIFLELANLFLPFLV